MARRDSGQPLLEKSFLVALAVVLALIAALFPLARQLDADADAPKETVEVGGETFSTATGVTVEVRRNGVGYCVRGVNEDGHRTRWRCYDGSEDPSPRGFSF